MEDKEKTKEQLIEELKTLRERLAILGDKEEIQKQKQDLELINSINSAVNSGKSLKEISDMLTDETKRMFASNGATIYLLNEDRKSLVAQKLTLPNTMIEHIEKLVGVNIPSDISFNLTAGGIYFKIVEEGKPRLIDNPKAIQQLMGEFIETPYLSDKLRQTIRTLIPSIYNFMGIQSVIVIPMISEGVTIGLLDISSKKPLTEADMKRLEAITGQLTVAFKRRLIDEQAQKRVEDLERFNKISVGRELKMMELKKEIKELNKEIERLKGEKLKN